MNFKQPLSFVSLVLVGAIALTGCGSSLQTKPSVDVQTETVQETPVAGAESASEPVAAGNGTVALLESLTVSDASVVEGYNRDYFYLWSTQGNGCDTRVAVLAREVKNGTVQGCDVKGEWVSIYDGVTIATASDLDIDHMVPLKEAWVSGANQWDDATREAFANDLEGPYSLIAVSASSNRSKSDNDPSTWMPPALDGCEYVARWVNVKHRWNLTVDTAEKDKILSVLSWCGGDYVLGESVPQAPVTVAPPVETEPVIENPQTGETDPQFSTCKEVNANGYGPYVKGVNPEYDWYRDGDGDGSVCE